MSDTRPPFTPQQLAKAEAMIRELLKRPEIIEWAKEMAKR